METKGIDDLISQLRLAETLAKAKPAAAQAGSPASGGLDFGAALGKALERVDGTQKQAENLARDFARGKGDIPLHEVMLAVQKANIAFQGTVQVRNRLVAAYQDIMNMQI